MGNDSNTSNQKKSSSPCWCLYQQLVDEVFGKGKITIKEAKDNNVIGTLLLVR